MIDQTQNQVEESAQVVELGFWGKFVNVFANPRKTFDVLNQKPTWFWPMLIMILIVVAVTQVSFPILMEKQLELIKSNPNIPSEQVQVIENQFAEHANTQRIITVVSQVIGTPLVFYLLLSFVFYFVGSVILGGDATFKKVLSVFSWSTCILILSSLILLPITISKGTIDVTLSPALLLAEDSVGTTLHTLLSKFDFFIIWFLAVFAYGFAVIYKFSLAKSYIAIGVLWGIWITISTVFADIFSRFTGM